MAYYPILMNPFHQVIDALRTSSTQPIKNNLSAHQAIAEDHFRLWIGSDACVSLNLLMSELEGYCQVHALKNSPIGLGVQGIAQKMWFVFHHYVSNRIEPDDKLGLCLWEGYVAGCAYVPTLSTRFPSLSAGDKLLVSLESHNPFDSKALLITTEKGDKLGYIPRQVNTIPAFLSEQDKSLFAILKRKIWNEDGYQLKVLLYVETP